MKKKVVVTGMGIVCGLGKTVGEYFNNLLAGKSSIKKITKIDLSLHPTQIGGEITDFNAEDYVDKKLIKRTDVFIHYALYCADMAVKSACLDRDADKINKDKVGIIIGSGIGGMQTFDDTAVLHSTTGWKKVSPFFIPSLITNMAGGQVAINFGYRGNNYSISTACATATHSIRSISYYYER